MKFVAVGIILIASCLLMFSANSQSLSYMDESGNIHFVDSISDIPTQYRNQVLKPTPTLSEKERKEQQQRSKRTPRPTRTPAPTKTPKPSPTVKKRAIPTPSHTFLRPPRIVPPGGPAPTPVGL